MPRSAKGGKWVYGWIVVGPQREITIPPEAQGEYGFQAGDQVIFLQGSQRSGGFGIGTPTQMSISLGKRVLGRSRIGEDGQVVVPTEVDVRPGDRLVAMRGNRYALGFVTRGPIYEAAAEHSELGSFSIAHTGIAYADVMLWGRHCASYSDRA
jgi:bifunctional DNA-binding transcriptional regulator/antitoxin component of YhaV-PrlF toxin-antitoxin module